MRNSKKEIFGIDMEILDVVNENGIPTGKTVERNYAHKHGILHRTSHVWILRVKNNRLQVLLQQRSFNKDSFPGMYDISSAGHIPAGADFKESAIRELEEELGVKADESDLIECGTRRFEFEREFKGNYFHDNQVSKIFYLYLDQDEFKIQKSELEGTLWIDFETCLKKVKENSFPHCIVPSELKMVLDKYQQVELEK